MNMPNSYFETGGAVFEMSMFAVTVCDWPVWVCPAHKVERRIAIGSGSAIHMLLILDLTV